MVETVDAVVIGAGQNGLVAASVLADAGWDVLVLEAQDQVGGAVRSANLWPESPDTTTDLFSAFYPLGAASPVMKRLELEKHGLTWLQAPKVLAHVTPDGPGAVLHQDAASTAAALEADAPGDGETWLRLFEQWQTLRDPLLNALFTPFPPVRSTAKLVFRAGLHDTLDLARLATMPVTRLAHELFQGEAGKLLLIGNAMHADAPMDGPGSGLFGWLLAMLAQDVGFPVPEGGASAFAEALANRARSGGARIETGESVTGVSVSAGRVRSVRTAGGREIVVRKAVLADVDAPRLFNELVGLEHLPARLRADLARFEWDLPTVKVNWLVDGGIPWTSPLAQGAGTVHVGADAEGLSRWSAALTANRAPEEVFMLLGQMTTSDASRSPEGTESAWAYTHLPRTMSGRGHAQSVAEAVEQTLEKAAPGFTDRIAHRNVQLPDDLEAADGNLHRGAINGGTAQLHQQLIFRPATGLGRAETVIEGLYLASAAIHPGGGVHGACGYAAARAALAGHGRIGGPVRLARRSAMKALYGKV